MLQRQARNAVGWFQQLMDSKWFNNIWIFNDSWVVPLKGFRFRGNYCSHLFTPSPRLPTHPKPGVVTMTEPFVRWETGITWNDPRVWSKSLAVAAHRDSAGNLWKQNVHSAVQNGPSKLPNVLLTANNLYCRSLSRMSTGIKRIQSFQQRTLQWHKQFSPKHRIGIFTFELFKPIWIQFRAK